MNETNAIAQRVYQKIEHADNCYCINSGELALLLESESNNQLKTNTALQMRDAGEEFKTI